MLATATSKEVKFWDAASWNPVTEISLAGLRSDAIAFSPDGRRLALTDVWKLRVWDRQQGVVETMSGHSMMRSAFSPDGRMLAWSDDDRTVSVWDVSDEALVGTFAGHKGDVNAVALTSDGRTLASCDNDATIRLWDVAQRAPIGELNTYDSAAPPKYAKFPRASWICMSVAFSTDGLMLASTDAVGTIQLWDVAQRASLGELSPTPLDPEPTHVLESSMVFTPDGRMLASANSGGGNAVRLWDVKSRTLLGTLHGHAEYVNSIALSPDGRIVASGSADDTVIMWDLQRRTRLATLTDHDKDVTGVWFSPDGRTLVSSSVDDTIIFWDVADRKLATRIDPWIRPGLFSATSGASDLRFGADGHLQIVFGGFGGGNDVIMDLEVERVAQRICHTLGRSLTRQEWTSFVSDQPYVRSCG